MHFFRKTSLQLFMSFAVSLLALGAHAEDPAELIKKKLEAAQSKIQVLGVKPSPIKGMYEVHLAAGPTVFVSEDGGFFVTGDMYKIETDGLVNLSEQKRDVVRAKALDAVDEKDMIIFAAKDNKPKAVINVFTDVDCFYCQKLHKEVPKMNELGIEVRYLAYPRAGLKSKTYDKMATAWCASGKERNEIFTKLKNRENVPIKVCDANPIAKEFNLGRSVGVSGTPAMVTETGRLLPGYLPADRLAETLGI